MMPKEDFVRLLHIGPLAAPCPKLLGESRSCVKINQSIRKNVVSWQAQLYALLQYERQRQAPYAKHGFAAQFSCQIMRLDEAYFSYFCDCYLTLGRVAPKLFRHSETYDLHSGKHLLLPDFFTANERWRYEVCHQIQQQCYADRQPAYTYFLSHPLRLMPDQFYLSDRGLVLWMQAEEIAPYNTGIPSFLLAAETLRPVLRRSL